MERLPLKATVLFDKEYLSADAADSLYNHLRAVCDLSRKKVRSTYPQSLRSYPQADLVVSTTEYTLNRGTAVFADDNIPPELVPKLWGDGVEHYKWTEPMAAVKAGLEDLFSTEF